MPKDNTYSEQRSWIFIRGLARHSEHWGPLLKFFKQRFPHDEVELLDLRGNGELAQSPSYVDITDNVRDLRARSKFIKAGKKVHLLTISLGSMVGVEWAEKFPEELESLTLMNTSDRGTSYFFERMRPANYKKVFSILSKGISPPLLESKIMELVTNNPHEYGEWAEKFAKLPSTTKTNCLRQMMAAARYEFPKHKPKTDILILSSEKDMLVHPACSEKIAQMWHLKTHVHPTAGHDIALEAPSWICEQLENWLGSSVKA